MWAVDPPRLAHPAPRERWAARLATRRDHDVPGLRRAPHEHRRSGTVAEKSTQGVGRTVVGRRGAAKWRVTLRQSAALSGGSDDAPANDDVLDPGSGTDGRVDSRGGAAGGAGGKPGGVLNVTQREDLPQGFAIHESSTISTTCPALPCFNNLVIFDQLKPPESMDTIVGELAEKWSWQDNYRNLVFFLRKDVKWHDGQPFTSKDVKFTFDMRPRGPRRAGQAPHQPAQGLVREHRGDRGGGPAHGGVPPQAAAALAADDARLRLLAGLRRPTSRPPSYRTSCIGTGPFKLKEWRHGEFVEYVKNPDYFVKGRPYLDGLKYVVIVERGTRSAALQAGQLDVAFPGETTKTDGRAAQEGRAAAGVHAGRAERQRQHHHEHQEAAVRQPEGAAAVSLRHRPPGPIQAVHQGGAVARRRACCRSRAASGACSRRTSSRCPATARPADDEGAGQEAPRRGRASRPQNPLKVEMATRAIAIYVDLASFVINELKQVGIEATLKQIETAQWHADGHARRLPDRRQPHRPRHRRSRRQLLRELRLRLAAQLQPVLQRGSHEDVRPAVAGARSEEAAGAGRRRSRSSSRRTRPGPSWAGASTTSRTGRT